MWLLSPDAIHNLISNVVSVDAMGLLDRLKYEVKSITIEPFVLLCLVSFWIDKGAQITNSLMIWKICHLELNYPDEICFNLTLTENADINIEVQKQVATIQTNAIYLGAVPALIYSFFLGSLSDDFGRKPLIVLPAIGVVLRDIALLINCIFIKDMPLQFFYMERAWFLFGGISIMYLGIYGYIAAYTKVCDRSYRLARCDGCETSATILGMTNDYELHMRFQRNEHLKTMLQFFFPFRYIHCSMDF